jgi:hypothetical protein
MTGGLPARSARAPSGHAATPAIKDMNSRRLFAAPRLKTTLWRSLARRADWRSAIRRLRNTDVAGYAFSQPAVRPVLPERGVARQGGCCRLGNQSPKSAEPISDGATLAHSARILRGSLALTLQDDGLRVSLFR